MTPRLEPRLLGLSCKPQGHRRVYGEEQSRKSNKFSLVSRPALTASISSRVTPSPSPTVSAAWPDVNELPADNVLSAKKLPCHCSICAVMHVTLLLTWPFVNENTCDFFLNDYYQTGVKETRLPRLTKRLTNSSLSTSKPSCRKVMNIFLVCMTFESYSEETPTPSSHFSFSHPPAIAAIILHECWPRKSKLSTHLSPPNHCHERSCRIMAIVLLNLFSFAMQ